MSLYDHPYFYFGMPVSYSSWMEARGKSFTGRDTARRYDRFYHKRKPKKRMVSHYNAHFGDHERYSNGQTVHWHTPVFSPHNSIYSQIKEVLGGELSGKIYDYTDLVHYERKRLKKRTRRGDEAILRRLGYVINH
jgi:hypothetical protein